MIIDNFILVVFTIFPVLFLFYLFPEAKNNMLSYLNTQVIGSIQSVQTVDSRFAIIGWFFQGIIIPLIMGLIIIIISLKKRVKKPLFKENLREALMLSAIVLSGVIPIMISMKQRSFYILTVYPLFSIGLAYYLYPMIKSFTYNMKIPQRGYKSFNYITIGIVFISIILSICQINRIGRDKEMILDSKVIIDIVGRNTTINICPEMYSMWSLHGYMSRYGNVSLDSNINNIHKYYLTIGDLNNNFTDDNYDFIPLKTIKYKLYKKKEMK